MSSEHSEHPEHSGGRPAVAPFESEALDRLRAELDPDFVPVLASRYVSLLPGRIRRVRDALTANDLDQALDASLSLKVSSSTIGTRELETLAHIIELDVRRADLDGARRTATGLEGAAARAETALTEYLSA